MDDPVVGLRADQFVVRINRLGKQPAHIGSRGTSKPPHQPVSAAMAPVPSASTSAAALRDRATSKPRKEATASGVFVAPLPRLPIEAYYLYPPAAPAAVSAPVDRPAGVAVACVPPDAAAAAAAAPHGDTHFFVWIVLGLAGAAGLLGALYVLVLVLLPTEERVSWFVSDVLPGVAVVLAVLGGLGLAAAAAGYYVYFYFPFLPCRINSGALALPTITLPTITLLDPPSRGTLATTGVALPAISFWGSDPVSGPGPAPAPAPAPSHVPTPAPTSSSRSKVQFVYKIN